MRNFFLLCLGLWLTAGCGSQPDPEEVLTRRTVGLAFLEENRLEEAEAEFQRLVSLAPDEPLGHANLAITYLRQARYEEAQASIQDAIELSPADPDLRLILATILGHAGQVDEQGSVLQALVQDHADHVKGLYTLSEWVRDEQPANASQRRGELLGAVVSLAPANLPARLQLIDLLLAAGLPDSARFHAEQVQSQLPDLPAEAVQPFAAALDAMRNDDAPTAATQMRLAHNALRVTQLYSAGILNVVGPGGPSVGFPVLTFSQDFSTRAENAAAVFATLQFNDGTALAGLDTVGGTSPRATAAGDFDNDGDHDVLIAGPSGLWVLQNGLGAFSVVSRPVSGSIHAVVLADIDNNGWLDAVLGQDQGVTIQFGSESAALDERSTRLNGSPVRHITPIDIDQDGDLDLVASGDGAPTVWRNNLDGTFTDRTVPAGFSQRSARAFEIGDFDDDGDVDVIGVTENTVVLFDNRREGRFEASDVITLADPRSIAVGDYTNDGWLDLFVVHASGGTLLRNQRDGSFTEEADAELADGLTGASWTHTAFVDADNDGRLDVLVAGAAPGSDGVRLFRNTGERFERRPDLSVYGGAAQGLSVLDYNEDGDVDLVVVTDRGVRLLRNDGGNGNRYLNVALVGLRAGNGKNNHFGIGAKVEVRAGDLYQVRVVTSPVTHFGLGQRLKADAVRIQWTNGVPQNLFYPGSDQDVVEEQTLKGSCAFLYTFNGTEYTFVTDIVWKSALGMPMGIMGGGSTYAPAYPSQEYVRIPADALVPIDGEYRISVTEELWEAAYLDHLTLLAVDHPDTVDVFVDERFRPPGPGTRFDPFVAGQRFPVERAVDDRGHDLTDKLRVHDFDYVDNLVPGPYQGVTEPHDLILTLGDEARGRDDIVLYLTGWLFPSDASINVAVAQSRAVSSSAPVLQVRDARGNWVTVDGELSFPSGKNKTVVVDLTGRFLSQDRSVRIRTNMEIYWDHAFFTLGQPQVNLRVTRLPVLNADLGYRGFSRMFRKGGPYGPHWFAYDDVAAEDPWGPAMEGNYTRFGSVTELLETADDRSVVMAPGDEVKVSFPATLPPPEVGWSRSFVLYSGGWIKDADMNTGTGNFVGPLPFRAASEYPYQGAQFKADDARRAYADAYNTRRITHR